MPRVMRRFAAVGVGLSLGWYLAGTLPTGFSQAESGEHAQPAEQVPYVNTDDHHGKSESAADPHHGHGAAMDQAEQASELLVPEADQITWYPQVVWIAVGLFATALVLGVPTLKLKPADEPEPAHDDAHDAAHH